MKTIISQFIPIIILMLLISFSNEFVNFSFSILGKFIALSIIMYYTYLDKYLGLIVCLIIIIYYQSDVVENMLNTDDIMEKMVEEFETKKREKEDSLLVENMQPMNPSSLNNDRIMSKVNDVYNQEVSNYENSIEGKELKDTFIKENCKGNKLFHKNMIVKPEQTSLIFPEIKYQDTQCNICDKTCNFSIEHRQKTETELISKFSRDKDITAK